MKLLGIVKRQFRAVFYLLLRKNRQKTRETAINR